MSSMTTSRSADHLRPAVGRRTGRALRAGQRIVVALAVGFIAVVVMPGTASAWTEPFVPAVPVSGTSDNPPAPIRPEVSALNPTTLVAIVVLVAVVVALAFAAQRFTHHRHQVHSASAPR